MKVSINTSFSGQEHEPLAEYIVGVGRLLEERGFSALWVGEHVVTFSHNEDYFYAGAGAPPMDMITSGFLDPISVLTLLATSTTTLRLGTGVALLPQRNPVYFAKMTAAIDILSNGRFVAGVGLGWSSNEWAAVHTTRDGTGFKQRGEDLGEYLRVVRSLWVDEISHFQGKFHKLADCTQLPRPIQTPHPPIYIGSEMKSSLRVLAELGQGWITYHRTPDELAPRFKVMQQVLTEHGRSLDDIEIASTPGVFQDCDYDMMARYADLGVNEMVVTIVCDGLESFTRRIDQLATELVQRAGGL